MLKEFLHSTYSHLKGIKLCGNLLVRNIFTSDIRYLPNITEQFGVARLPKEISFHVPKGTSFTDLYNFITFPVVHTDKANVKENVVVKKPHVICEPVGVENVKPPTVENIPVKYPNTTTSRQDSRMQGRRRDRQSPTSVIISTPAVTEDVSSYRQGAVVDKRNSEGTKVRMISIVVNAIL